MSIQQSLLTAPCPRARCKTGTQTTHSRILLPNKKRQESIAVTPVLFISVRAPGKTRPTPSTSTQMYPINATTAETRI